MNLISQRATRETQCDKQVKRILLPTYVLYILLCNKYMNGVKATLSNRI